jgi:hypothetical protein
MTDAGIEAARAGHRQCRIWADAAGTACRWRHGIPCQRAGTRGAR